MLKKDWAKSSPLPQHFYSRHTVEVAQDLLGKLLIVRANPLFPIQDPRSETVIGRIVETEAYRADDPASHSCRGETPRTSVMFGDPGVAYVYFIYGMYEMLNFVTEPKRHPGAVLIRALEPLSGLEWLQKRRNLKQVNKTTVDHRNLTNGPGKLCRAMGILGSDNKANLQGPRLLVIDDGETPNSISKSERIGIRLGTEKLWRFFITDNVYVSPAKQNAKSILI